MSFQDHNEYRLILPDGKTRSDCKRQLQHSGLSDRARSGLLLMLDQAHGFTVTVKFIRDNTGWGEDRWTTIREELSRAGILVQVKKKREDGSSRWSLQIDCTPLFSTGITKPRYHARSRDTGEMGGSRACA